MPILGNIAKNLDFLYKIWMSITYEQAAREIIAAGQRLDARGLAPATAGNYSIRLGDGTIAITVSGRHKGRMNESDIMLIDAEAKPLVDKKPSAETLLHTHIYKRYPHANAVLHTHSIPGVALTRFLPRNEYLTLEGYELLKAFPGIDTHATRIDLPVFSNTQDMRALSVAVDAKLEDNTPAYLIRDHGIYVWGRDMEEAERVAEALEHLLHCEIEMMKLTMIKNKGAVA
jgi:methylthioribulose-1-phosphate dehydratase